MSPKQVFLFICDNLLPPVVSTAGVKNVYTLHKGLVPLGAEVHVLTATTKWTGRNWPEWVKRQSLEGITLHVIDSPLKRLERIWFLWTRVAYLICAYQLWRKFRYPIIHDYSSSPLMFNRSGLLSRLTRAKTIHTLATAPSDYNRTYRPMAFHPDLIIFPNDYMQKNLRFSVNGTPSRILPIPIGNRFFKADHPGCPAKTGTGVTLLYAGLLRKNKGVDHLVNVLPGIMNTCPDLGVLIVAPPGREHSIADPLVLLTQSDRFRTRRMDGLAAATAGFEKRVRLINETVDMRNMLDAVDIFVYPLTTLHGTLVSASTLIEAMARGKAIVASNLPELRGLLKDRVNCLLFPPADIARFQQSIETLAGDAELRKRLGHHARIDSAGFNAARVSKNLFRLYTDLLSSDQAG